MEFQKNHWLCLKPIVKVCGKISYSSKKLKSINMLKSSFVRKVEAIAGEPSSKMVMYSADKLANIMHRLFEFADICETKDDRTYRDAIYHASAESLDALVCMQREVVHTMRYKFTKKEVEFMLWVLAQSLFDWHQDLLIFKRTFYDYIKYDSSNWFDDNEREELCIKIAKQNKFEFALLCSVMIEAVNVTTFEMSTELRKANPEISSLEGILVKFLTKKS